MTRGGVPQGFVLGFLFFLDRRFQVKVLEYLQLSITCTLFAVRNDVLSKAPGYRIEN